MPAPLLTITKIYATGTIVAAALMLGALCWPAEQWPTMLHWPTTTWAVAALAAVPLVGALVTAGHAVGRDRPLFYAALLTLGGLGAVGVCFGLS